MCTRRSAPALADPRSNPPPESRLERHVAKPWINVPGLEDRWRSFSSTIRLRQACRSPCFSITASSMPRIAWPAAKSCHAAGEASVSLRHHGSHLGSLDRPHGGGRGTLRRLLGRHRGQARWRPSPRLGRTVTNGRGGPDCQAPKAEAAERGVGDAPIRSTAAGAPASSHVTCFVGSAFDSRAWM